MDLPLICEGVASALAPAEASRLGVGFVNLFLRGRDSRIEKPLQTLRSAKQTALYFPVYGFAEAASVAPVLQTRLYITEEILADFALGRVEGLVLLEELHTAAEQIMRELLDKTDKQNLSQALVTAGQQLGRAIRSNPSKMSWPELRATCQELGYFPETNHFVSLTQDINSVIDHTHNPDEALDKLSQLRNTAKHKGSPDQPWVHDHWECVSAILEHLVRKLA
jgi:hypothetical protein